MVDIREGRASDPFRETLSSPSSRVKLEKPTGTDLVLNDDGTATIEGEDDTAVERGHLDNLALDIPIDRLRSIATDYLDLIEVDIEAHRSADKQYEEALRRTGLGNDAPGGAPFNGASRAVHPGLLEACIDYAARVAKELLPPEGPVKAQIVGKPTNDKSSRAERVARFMNYQLTQQMPAFYNELEMGLPQQALAGAFYTKLVVIDGQPAVEVVYSDKVHRPYGDGDFYTQQRITHEMTVSRQEFDDNVESGLWADTLDPTSATDLMDNTSAEIANDRIIGQGQPTQNVDDLRTVYEVSTRLALDPNGSDEEKRVLPYILTIDEQTQQVLAIYRNWREDDPNYFRLDFLIEWPFIPWRGGYPIGFGRMIGSLSGAASGALRALLDAALLNSMQTGVKLKGGATVGGQNIRPQPGSTTEVQGSLAQDPDIRKTYMPLEFPAPSPVLMELLGFLVDAGRGVVRTTFDEMNKMNGETPVGTANLMIEQGLTTYGSIYGRQHRAMRRFLNQLWIVNQHTVDDEQIMDDFGELVVTKEDFTGPMTVVPVSDPRIFTDAQRLAQAQMIASRAQTYVTAGVPMYKARASELYLLRQAKVPDPEQFLIDAPEAVQMTAVSENTAASNGMPIKAFPGQDHEAHIAQHAAYIQSPLFGSNPVLAPKVLPQLVAHIGEHMALWYDDAMKVAANLMLQQKLKDPRITLDALETVGGLEVQLDRLTAMLTPQVMQHAQKELSPVLEILAKAQQLMQSLQQPQPMDPSVVAAMDVKRQEQKDKADIELKAKEIEQKGQLGVMQEQRNAAQEQTQAQLEQERIAQDERQHAADIEQRREAVQTSAMTTLAGQDVQRSAQDVTLQTEDMRGEVQRDNADTNADVTLTVARENNDAKLEVADKQAKAAKEAAKLKPKPAAKKPGGK